MWHGTQLLALWEAGLGLFYPAVCQLCGKERATATEGFVGSECRRKVRFIEAPFCSRCGLPFEGDINGSFTCSNCAGRTLYFQSARAAVRADEFMLPLIHRYKYNRALHFEPFLAELLLREALPVLKGQNWSCIVPVPLHPVKLREREFNQAERLARHLGKALSIPVNTGLVERVVPTLTQTKLGRDERARNMLHAFAPRPKVRLPGERIILVDDVLTTGATTSACAKALRQAGAQEICVWALARKV